MEVTIETGQGIIDIVSDGFVYCLKIRKLVLVECWDALPTTARYYAGTLDYERVIMHFNEVLINGGDEDIFHTVAGFLDLFSPGTYTIEIDRNIGPRFNLHTQYTKTNNGIFVYGAHGDAYIGDLMFTQDPSNINKERVAEYEQLIADGLRPKAVVFRANFEHSGVTIWSPDQTSSYILDGHHKLLAYQNLKIQPELVIITREVVDNEQGCHDQENLFFDYEHLLSDEIKQEIIGYAPKMIVGNSAYALQYNQLLDSAIRMSGRIAPPIWTLFKEALLSGEKDKIEWAKTRLDNLGKKQFEQSPLWVVGEKILYTDEHPNGVYESLTIRSQADFKNWIESLIAVKE
jgi:hypothetical protein